MSNTQQNSRWYHKLAFVIAGLLLIFYPFVFFASLLSLVASADFDTSIIVGITAQLFLWLSILYPIFFAWCLWYFVRRPTSRYRLYMPWLPFGYILLCVGLFQLWDRVEILVDVNTDSDNYVSEYYLEESI